MSTHAVEILSRFEFSLHFQLHQIFFPYMASKRGRKADDQDQVDVDQLCLHAPSAGHNWKYRKAQSKCTDIHFTALSVGPQTHTSVLSVICCWPLSTGKMSRFCSAFWASTTGSSRETFSRNITGSSLLVTCSCTEEPWRITAEWQCVHVCVYLYVCFNHNLYIKNFYKLDIWYSRTIDASQCSSVKVNQYSDFIILHK